MQQTRLWIDNKTFCFGKKTSNFHKKIIRKFVGLTAKTYSYLIDDSSEDDKAKGRKKCAIKRKLKFENYKTCLKATQLENKRNCLEKKIDIVLKNL